MKKKTTPQRLAASVAAIPRTSDPEVDAILDELNRNIAKELRRQMKGRTAKRAR